MVSLVFDRVTLAYPIYNSRGLSLRHQLVRLGTGGCLSQDAHKAVHVTALNNLSFRLEEGDRLGLVGHNGAGKTTLLRTMAGIYTPTSGTVTQEGRLSTVIELGAGLDHELSGHENILRMGMMLGMSRAFMNQAMEDIIAFSELGDFLSLPVHTYSSGMLMRMMFSVGTAVNPEIFLLDEMFATGDASFQKKAEKRIVSMIEEAKIFVFASHNPELIKKYCNKIFVLEHGVLKDIQTLSQGRALV